MRQTLVQRNLVLRSRIFQAVRTFFAGRDFLEVETPCRVPALAPESHIEAPPSGDWFLHTSPEICMKRLLSAGYPRIFQICRCFREGERGERHLPEFTMLEWYRAQASYETIMDECEDLIRASAECLGLGDRLKYRGNTIDLSPGWPRLSVVEAFERFSPLPLAEALLQDRFDEMIGTEIEPQLGIRRPVFLCDYPAEKGALARLKPGNPAVAERFELYIGGLELCNAFTELSDPAEQRRRFELEQRCRHEMGKRNYPMPEPFLAALEQMPEAAGNALGLDRMVMLLTGSADIRDVVAFTPEEL